MLLRHFLCVWLVLALSFQVNASEQLSSLQGRVVAVADGDTVTVLDADQTTHRIRLQGIDAPESRQAFGQRARQYLAALVHQQEVEVAVDKIDRFGRVVGVIYRDGEDINLRMVQAGMAWHYRHYAREQTPEQRRAYAAAEQQARQEQRGLWADPNPMAPWDFRRTQRR